MSLMIKLRSTSLSSIITDLDRRGEYTNTVIKLTGNLTVRLNAQFTSPFLIEDEMVTICEARNKSDATL